MSNYDFTLDDKNKKSKTITKSKNSNLECIDGFVGDGTKHDLYNEIPSSKIPPGNLILSHIFIQKKIYNFLIEWRPHGMFERIMGKCINIYSQSSNISNINVNTRQSEIKKIEQAPTVDKIVKKGKLFNKT